MSSSQSNKLGQIYVEWDIKTEILRYVSACSVARNSNCPMYTLCSGAPNLSPEAQTALTTSLLGLTLKLTGAKLAFKLKLPGGKMRAKNRTEVVAYYLALIQV